ncbi:hypothetical protein KFE25_007484 [Diacronema lutheri]|uniref:Uncharacterized protein n=1 Tax=Diacronema lutheri TaxID=2081491 RepID=A0A8J6CFC3_DIALT|nr:hypothetical protein KFE25_007484 [Diacronema lutheri]
MVGLDELRAGQGPLSVSQLREYVHLLRTEHAQGLRTGPALSRGGATLRAPQHATPRAADGAGGGRDLVGDFRARLSDVLRSGRPARRHELDADADIAADVTGARAPASPQRRSLSPARVDDGRERLEDVVKLQRLRNRLSGASFEAEGARPSSLVPKRTSSVARAPPQPARRPSRDDAAATSEDARDRPSSAQRRALASTPRAARGAYPPARVSARLAQRMPSGRPSSAASAASYVSSRSAQPRTAARARLSRGVHARLAAAATAAGLSRISSRVSVGSASITPRARSSRARSSASAPASPARSSRSWRGRQPHESHDQQPQPGQRYQSEFEPLRQRRQQHVIAVPSPRPLAHDDAAGDASAGAGRWAEVGVGAAPTTRRAAPRRQAPSGGGVQVGATVPVSGARGRARLDRAPSIAERLERLEEENARLLELLAERGVATGAAARGAAAAPLGRAQPAQAAASTAPMAGRSAPAPMRARRDIDVAALQAELAEANAIRRRQERHIQVLTRELGDVAAQAAQVQL